ncbi:hypothetical protein [Salinicoccus sediminis]|nr:hypothetical protein [Salinicoccus sediminis]
MLNIKPNPQRRPNFNIKKLKEKAVRLETTKDGKVVLEKNNPKHVDWHNE